jgi:flagellar hook-associated protein 3 FlgL
MKVTDSSTYRLMQSNLDRITNDLSSLYEQGATGLKLNKPSDDPGAIRPVLTTRTQLQQNDRYLETMGVAGDKMAATESHLDTVENVLVRMEEIAINSINSSLSESDLTTLADEVATLKDQLLYSANARIDGKYIFAGFKQDTPPFTENPGYDPDLYDISDSSTWAYIYNGDHNRTQLEISPGEYMEVNLTGNELFMGISNEVAATGTTDPFLGGTQGGIDIFTVLTRAEEAIRAGNVDDINGPGGSIGAQLNNLEIAADQNRSFRAKLGLKAAQVEKSIEHQEGAALDLEKILSRYQDADMINVFNEIAEQETAFEAALSITGRISRISILEYF